MKNIHSTITWSKADEYPEFFDLADKVGELLDITVENLGKRSIRRDELSLAQIIILFNTYKASNSFISCLILCDKGFAGDTKTICRKLIEIHISIRYLLMDREKYEQLYWNYLTIQLKRDTDKALKNKMFFPEDYLDLIQDVRKLAIERLQEIEKEWEKSDEGKVVGNYKRFWSGMHLSEMAKKCGLGYEYYRPYLSYCRSTHSNIDDIFNYFDFNENSFYPFAEIEEIPLVLYDCINNMIGILDCSINAFNMDLLSSLKQLKELVSIAEKEWLVKYSNDSDE